MYKHIANQMAERSLGDQLAAMLGSSPNTNTIVCNWS